MQGDAAADGPGSDLDRLAAVNPADAKRGIVVEHAQEGGGSGRLGDGGEHRLGALAQIVAGRQPGPQLQHAEAEGVVLGLRVLVDQMLPHQGHQQAAGGTLVEGGALGDLAQRQGTIGQAEGAKDRKGAADRAHEPSGSPSFGRRPLRFGVWA